MFLSGNMREFMPVLFWILIFVVFYLFFIRPQKKKQNELRNFRNSISVGQNVVTAGGIYGVVKQIDEADNALMIEVANGVRIKVDRNSVYSQAQPTQAQETLHSESTNPIFWTHIPSEHATVGGQIRDGKEEEGLLVGDKEHCLGAQEPGNNAFPVLSWCLLWILAPSDSKRDVRGRDKHPSGTDQRPGQHRDNDTAPLRTCCQRA